MTILIIDYSDRKHEYELTFKKKGYENNELVFVHCFQDAKEFINERLTQHQSHLDLIITNNSAYSDSDILKAKELLQIKMDSLNEFSLHNFRISSIPIILHSEAEDRRYYPGGYNYIINRNTEVNFDNLIFAAESAISGWRNTVLDDGAALGIDLLQFGHHWKNTSYMDGYYYRVARSAEKYFYNYTKTLSLDYIKMPRSLNYDWIKYSPKDIERVIDEYGKMFRHHVKYDRYNNERTIIHKFFLDNPVLLLRDNFEQLHYEKQLKVKDSINRHACDFILSPHLQDIQPTHLFEIKKEDVKYLTRKNQRYNLTADLNAHLGQLDEYRYYAEQNMNAPEFEREIGYYPANIQSTLLAGRQEETDELRGRFDFLLSRRYPGHKVISFDELENTGIEFYYKFARINSK